jgi:dipeptidyl aminopeptidase/acylaminoacyl peptidase
MTTNVIPATGGEAIRYSPVFARIDYNYYPQWIENDASIAYVSFRGLNFSSPLEPSLTVVDAFDTDIFTEFLLDMNSPLDVQVAPDGSAVAFSDFLTLLVIGGGYYNQDDSSVLIRRETFVSDLTAIWYAPFPLTGEAERLDGTDGARGLCWSPGSDTLAFSRDDFLYLIPTLGGTAEPLFEGEDPAWSPDGTKVACTIEGDIYVYQLSDGTRTRVTTEGGVDPAWSPDSRKLAFSWARDENFDIYIVDLDDITPAR